jgi:hypothetical protein
MRSGVMKKQGKNKNLQSYDWRFFITSNQHYIHASHALNTHTHQQQNKLMLFGRCI